MLRLLRLFGRFSLEQKVVEMIDSRMKLVSVFRPWVYRVSLYEQNYILKLPLGSNLEAAKREIHNLQIAYQVEGITHLVRVYQPNVMLKEYASGKILAKRKLKGYQRDQLETTVIALHNQELVALDLCGENIVISNSGENATLVDLDNALYRVKSAQFKCFCHEDLLSLARL